MASLPGDPGEDGAMEMVHKEDLQALAESAMLQTKVLDYVLYYRGKPSMIIDGVNFAPGSILRRKT